MSSSTISPSNSSLSTALRELMTSMMNSSTSAPVTSYNPSMGHIYPIPIAVATFVVSVLGVFCNFLIILVIISSKQLHNRCYVLIGYLAFSDLICSIYYSLLRILIFTYNYYLTNYTCFLYSFVGLFALNTQTGLTVMLGVDRFLAVFAPYKYRQWKPQLYILCMVIPPNIYAILVTGYGWMEATNSVVVPVCFPPSAYNSSSRNIWVISNGVIIFLVLILYSAAQIKFKMSQTGSTTDASTKMASRVLKSLMIVMLVYASTWAFTMIMMFIISVTGFLQ